MTPKTIGRYEIISELGRGGMATVYRAHDPNFDRGVALKVLPREFLHDSQFRERFQREARIIAGLEHSAIVPVHDYGEDDGLLYLVMRFMTGGSLEDRIKEGAIPLQDTARIVSRLSVALDEAHYQGIIHRDLKPANILFDQYGDAYLSDFGIARLAEAGGSLTGTGIIGTPAYMSPEQARGDRDLDGRSDVYAFGVIVFEMLTGQAPYDSDTPMGVAVKHILDPIPEILEVKDDLPPDVDNVIKRALAKDREVRYRTAADLATGLSAVAEGQALPDALRATGTESNVTVAVASAAPTLAGPPSSSPTQQAQHTEPLKVKKDKTRERPRFRGCIYGCLLPVGLLTVVFLAVFFAFRSVTLEILSAIPGVPPGVFNSLLGSDVELTGEMARHEINQELVGMTELDVRISVTQASVEVGALEGIERRVTGFYETDAALDPITPDYETRVSRAILKLEQPDAGFGEIMNALTVNLPSAIPLDLTVTSHLGDVFLDLTDLNLRSLTVEGGAGKIRIKLPEQGDLAINIEGGAGEVIVEAPDNTERLHVKKMTFDGGFGAFSIELPASGTYDVVIKVGLGSAAIKVPDGLEARVIYVGDLTMLNDRFTQTDNTTWDTEGYGAGANQATIEVQGSGSIRVED